MGWIMETIERAGLGFHLGNVIEAVCTTTAGELTPAERVGLLERARAHLDREIALANKPAGSVTQKPAAAKAAQTATRATPAPVRKGKTNGRGRPRKAAASVEEKQRRQAPAKVQDLVKRTRAYFREYPDSTWARAFLEVENPYKNAMSLQSSIGRYMKLKLRKGPRKRHTTTETTQGAAKHQPNGRKGRKQTLAEAQALARLREEALKSAALDGIEFANDEERECYVETFIENS